jgi:hypothetical protein
VVRNAGDQMDGIRIIRVDHTSAVIPLT